MFNVPKFVFAAFGQGRHAGQTFPSPFNASTFAGSDGRSTIGWFGSNLLTQELACS